MINFIYLFTFNCLFFNQERKFLCSVAEILGKYTYKTDPIFQALQKRKEIIQSMPQFPPGFRKLIKRRKNTKKES